MSQHRGHRARFLAYLEAYAAKDISAVAATLADEVCLRDWNISVRGKAAALKATAANFSAARSIAIEPLRLFESATGMAGELRILVDGSVELFVVDVIEFNEQGLITGIRAYLGRADQG